MESEAPNIIRGLTANEVKDGVQIVEWNYGHLKYKVLEDHIQWTTIYVEPNCREQGYGTTMMEWVENEARRLGKKYMVVKAFTDGKTDILGVFLKKLKYKDTGNFIWRKEL